MAEDGADGAERKGAAIHRQNVFYVFIGTIAVLLWIVGYQYRQLQFAEDTIDILNKRVQEMTPAYPKRLRKP